MTDGTAGTTHRHHHHRRSAVRPLPHRRRARRSSWTNPSPDRPSASTPTRPPGATPEPPSSTPRAELLPDGHRLLTADSRLDILKTENRTLVRCRRGGLNSPPRSGIWRQHVAGSGKQRQLATGRNATCRSLPLAAISEPFAERHPGMNPQPGTSWMTSDGRCAVPIAVPVAEAVAIGACFSASTRSSRGPACVG